MEHGNSEHKRVENQACQAHFRQKPSKLHTPWVLNPPSKKSMSVDGWRLPCSNDRSHRCMQPCPTMPRGSRCLQRVPNLQSWSARWAQLQLVCIFCRTLLLSSCIFRLNMIEVICCDAVWHASTLPNCPAAARRTSSLWSCAPSQSALLKARCLTSFQKMRWPTKCQSHSHLGWAHTIDIVLLASWALTPPLQPANRWERIRNKSNRLYSVWMQKTATNPNESIYNNLVSQILGAPKSPRKWLMIYDYLFISLV